MTKYKIVYNREECIGAAACVAVDEDLWIMQEDGKVDLKNGIYNEETGKWEIWIDEEEFGKEKIKKLKESAEVCPVDVIEIYDEEGKKVA